MKNRFQVFNFHKTKCLFFALGVFVLSEKIQAQAIINGIAPDTSIHIVELYQIADGNRIKTGDDALSNSNREFAFVVNLKKPGLVYLSNAYISNSSVNPKDVLGDISLGFYLHPDESLSVQLSHQQSTISEGSVENKYLCTWFNLVSPLLKYVNGSETISADKYVHLLQQTKLKSVDFLHQIKSRDAEFSHLIKLMVAFDLDYAAMYRFFLGTPSKIPSGTLNSFVHQKRFTDAGVMSFKEFQSALHLFARLTDLNDSISHKNITGKKAALLSYISNDTLKGVWVAAGLDKMKDYTVFMNEAAPYKQYMTTASLMGAFQVKENYLKSRSAFATGKEAFHFSLKDVNDQTVRMEDLCGKLVLVDAWATWCMPCKAQLPFLKQLEEDMKGRDITFVSVSIDVPEATQKWKNMVQQEKLGGIQLIDDSKKSFHEFYQLYAIPRFLIFSKDGKIISTDAPRPSDPELKVLLEKLLKENS